MSITKKAINGNEYLFINSCKGNRSGFVHESKLYKNERLISEYRIQYINRTWECYQYQSVMRGAVNILIGEITEAFKENWKEAHGFKKLTEARRKAMHADFIKNPPENYAELEELYKTL